MKSPALILILLLLCFSYALFVPNVKANPAYEDLTTFTKWGADQAKITAVTAERSTVTQLYRYDEAILYKSYGAGHFNMTAGIEHDFDYYVDDDNYAGGSGEASTMIVIWALVNATNDLQALINGGEDFPTVFIDLEDTDTKHSLNIVEWRNYGRYFTDSSIDLNEDTWYYIKLTINADLWKLGIYSTAGLRNVGDATDGDIDNLSGTLYASDMTFEYFYSVMSRDNFGYWITMWQEKYDIHEAVAVWSVTFYNNTGGILRADNVTVANGTETEYANETVIELIAIVEGNLTYGFDNFTWNGNYNYSNPSLWTITYGVSNLTLWCYFGAFNGDAVEERAFGTLGFVVVVIAVAIGGAILGKKLL